MIGRGLSHGAGPEWQIAGVDWALVGTLGSRRLIFHHYTQGVLNVMPGIIAEFASLCQRDKLTHPHFDEELIKTAGPLVTGLHLQSAL